MPQWFDPPWSGDCGIRSTSCGCWGGFSLLVVFAGFGQIFGLKFPLDSCGRMRKGTQSQASEFRREVGVIGTKTYPRNP